MCVNRGGGGGGVASLGDMAVPTEWKKAKVGDLSRGDIIGMYGAPVVITNIFDVRGSSDFRDVTYARLDTGAVQTQHMNRRLNVQRGLKR